mmetsp:Transcript_2870/g.6697  ORF Transcript_2870/g.6697 Transcript_2870/m.6697 type:complete len:101 (-) Transcript_2870:826-1128(-)
MCFHFHSGTLTLHSDVFLLTAIPRSAASASPLPSLIRPPRSTWTKFRLDKLVEFRESISTNEGKYGNDLEDDELLGIITTFSSHWIHEDITLEVGLCFTW